MTPPRQIHNLALIGFMGSGKSSVGHAVAEQLHFTFLDTDELIESRHQKSISEIFAQEGEAKFREYEAQVVAELASRRQTIISTGGGIGANLRHLEALKEHAFVVCLWASPEKIWERVKHQTHRPLLQETDPQAKIRQLLAVREPAYKQADIILNTDLRPLKEVASLVAHHFQQSRSSRV